jgi:hypothetical protein
MGRAACLKDRKYPVLEKPFPIEELERCLASLLR